MAAITVIITETLKRTIILTDRSSPEDALDYIEKEYDNSNIVLDSGDFTDVTFSAEEITEEITLHCDRPFTAE